MMHPRKKPYALPITVLPPKQWRARATVAVLVSLSVALITLSKTNQPALMALQRSANDILAPVAATVSAPVQAIKDAGSAVSSWFSMHAQIAALKEENARLLIWQEKALSLEAENRTMRNMLHVAGDSSSTYITARIVGASSGPYVRSALISAGASDGIAQNQAVISDKGLVGRVMEAGSGSARVLLLTDINSRVPVMGEDSRARGIVAGNNTALLTLEHVSSQEGLSEGERLITSGDGGVFPAGIPVGIVRSTEPGNIIVQPLADADALEMVTAVQHQL